MLAGSLPMASKYESYGFVPADVERGFIPAKRETHFFALPFMKSRRYDHGSRNRYAAAACASSAAAIRSAAWLALVLDAFGLVRAERALADCQQRRRRRARR